MRNPHIIQIIAIPYKESDLSDRIIGHDLYGVDTAGNIWVRRYNHWDTWELSNPTKTNP